MDANALRAATLDDATLSAFNGLYSPPTALIAADPTPNRLMPMAVHILYDLIAFIIVIRDFRKHESEETSQTNQNQ